MAFKARLAALFIAAGMTACNPQTDTPETPSAAELQSAEKKAPDEIAAFTALLDTPMTVSGTSEADLSDLISALPDYVSVSWDTQSLNAATGATDFTGLAVSFGAPDTPIGIRFDTASVWGLETDLLTARLKGERLSDSGKLFDRLEGENGRYFGFAAGFNTLFEGLLEQIGEEMPEGAELRFDAFEATIADIALQDVSLRPWELVPAPDALFAEIDEDEREMARSAAHIGQKLIAISRSVAYDNVAMRDLTGSLKMVQPGAEVEAAFSWELYGYSGVRGFDYDRIVSYNSRTRQSTEATSLPDAAGPLTSAGLPVGINFAQDESIGLMVVEDIRLDKALGFLARSELPGMEERDLLSLGRWKLTDYAAKLNDNEVFTINSVAIDADQFAWVIPEHITYDLDGMTVGVSELSEFFKVFFEAGLASMSEIEDESEKTEMELVLEGIDKAIDLLPEHGLDTITFDADGQANWNADSGLSDFAASSKAEGFGETVFDFALDLPIYSQLQAAFESEDKEAAFETAFEDAFAFRGLRVKLVDGGGYDKILGFAQAIGKAYPDEGWGAMLGNMDPPQMRSYMATMIRMAKSEAERELPEAARWIESYASFIESGGTFEAISQPPRPINKALIDSYDDEPEPEEFVEIFGITVTHTN